MKSWEIMIIIKNNFWEKIYKNFERFLLKILILFLILWKLKMYLQIVKNKNLFLFKIF